MNYLSFFILITKVESLAHVVCLTSDSYYLEELYNDTKLSNTSRFKLIEHLSEKDIYYWLGEKEGLEEEIIKDIWDNLGGSVWEIWQVLVGYKNTGNHRETLDDLIQVKHSLLKDYAINSLKKKWREAYFRMLKELVMNGEYILTMRPKDEIVPLIKGLVDKDIWFYDTKTLTIAPNSKNFEIGMSRLLEEL